MSTPFWQVWLGQTTNSNPQGSGSDASVNSNVLKQTYINRFLDVSGTFTVRYDASINGNLYLGPNSRLGLGLTAPAYILDQSGTARMQSPNSASYTSSPHTNQGNHGLVLTSTKASPGTAYSMGLGIDFSSGAGYITTGFINSSGTPTAQPLILNATGGDVGIGYKNPTAGLFVVGNQTVTGSATLGTYDAPAFYGNTVASFLNSVTPVGGGVSNAATIELGALNRDILTGYTAGANTNSVYKYAITSTVNNSTGCDLDIKGITIGSTLTGTGSTAVSRLYISPAGNVGIGTTSPAYTLDVVGRARIDTTASTTPYLTLGQAGSLTANTALWCSGQIALAGRIYFYYNWAIYANSGGNMYFLYSGNPETATGGAYVTAGGVWTNSDLKFKNSINDLSIGLKEVLKLRAVTYVLNSVPERGEQIGFIAQELQEQVPLVVEFDKDNDGLCVNYVQIIPVLTKAIQEQNVIVQELKTENADLKSRLNALEARLTAAGF